MLEETTISKRIEWIDYAKAIAIILVGVGHYSCPSHLLVWVYTFHMPLFLMLSGCTFHTKKYNFLEFLKRKMKTLIIPWWIAIIINISFQFFCKSVGISAGDSTLKNIPLRMLVALRPGAWDPIYWFIPCVFVVEILLFLILKRNDSLQRILALIIISAIMTALYKGLIDIRLPWTIDLIPVGALFILLGYLYIHYIDIKINQLHKAIKLIVAIILMVVGSSLGFLNGRIIGQCMSITSQRYGNILLMILSAILCSFAIILICQMFSNKFIGYIGENSIFLYFAYPITYKVADILLILIFRQIPFYEYSYAGNYFDLILLHISSNLLALLYVYFYKKIKDIIKRKLK